MNTSKLLEKISQLPKSEVSRVAGYCNSLLDDSPEFSPEDNSVDELIGFLEGIEVSHDPEDTRLEYILEKHGSKE